MTGLVWSPIRQRGSISRFRLTWRMAHSARLVLDRRGLGSVRLLTDRQFGERLGAESLAPMR